MEIGIEDYDFVLALGIGILEYGIGYLYWGLGYGFGDRNWIEYCDLRLRLGIQNTDCKLHFSLRFT